MKGNDIMKAVKHILLFLFMMIALSGCTAGKEEVIELNLLTTGYEDTRYTSIFNAIQQFNKENSGRKYILNVDQYTNVFWDWDAYNDQFREKYKDGSVDIFITTNEDIGELADQKLIEPLDDVLKKASFTEEYFSPLWESIIYEGHKYGFLIETEVRIVFISREVLRQLGFSEEDILALPELVKQGIFTMDDLLTISRKSVEKNLTQYGILHRPTKGTFFYMMAKDFGAISYDENHEIIINQAAFEDMLDFYYNLTHTLELTPKNSTRVDWHHAYKEIINHNTAVFFGASWSIYDMVTELGASSEEILSNYMPMLFPSVRSNDQPSTISNTMVCTIASNSQYKDDIKQILEIAYTDWDANAIHSVNTFHLPVSQSAAQNPIFQNNSFLNNIMYMLDYTTLMPSNVNIKQISSDIFQAVSGVEMGEIKAKQAAKEFKEKYPDSH